MSILRDIVIKLIIFVNYDNMNNLSDFLKLIQVTSIIIVLAVLILIDYIMISLLITGKANLVTVMTAPSIIFTLAMIFFALKTVIRYVKYDIKRLDVKSRVFTLLYSAGIIISLIYLLYMTILQNFNVSVVIISKGLSLNNYLLLGIALYTAGTVMIMWHLIERSLNIKLLMNTFIKIKCNSDDRDEETILIR